MPHTMGADEFLPLFIYVLALSGLHTAGKFTCTVATLLHDKTNGIGGRLHQSI